MRHGGARNDRLTIRMPDSLAFMPMRSSWCWGEVQALPYSGKRTSQMGPAARLPLARPGHCLESIYKERRGIEETNGSTKVFVGYVNVKITITKGERNVQQIVRLE